ncbi:MAG: hypothetical protein RMA76_38095 [Deltaproteobacteria bacterium]|jgi:uncharacterized protein HemX
MTNDTGKTRAIIREEISRSGPPPAPVTDDLPVTKRHVRLVWAIVVALIGVIGTGVGVIVSTTEAATTARMSIVVNREKVDELVKRVEKLEAAGAEERDRVTRLEGKIDTLLIQSSNIEKSVERLSRKRER